MRIEVIASLKDAGDYNFSGKTVLVIDVLRATSNMVTAFDAGCAAIVPVETVEQAKLLHEPDDLLCGERNCVIIPGFDLGNSPFEYQQPKLLSRRLIMTTTNGTRALQRAEAAQRVFASCLLNARASAQAAASFDSDILLLCSGTNDTFSLEDGLCAGAVIRELIDFGMSELSICDLGKVLLGFWDESGKRSEEMLLGCQNGKRLAGMGFTEDILYCSKLNALDSVPVLCGGTLLPLEETVSGRSKSPEPS